MPSTLFRAVCVSLLLPMLAACATSTSPVVTSSTPPAIPTSVSAPTTLATAAPSATAATAAATTAPSATTAAVVTAPASAPVNSPTTNTLRVADIYGWPVTLDPQKVGGSELSVMRLGYEGLTRLNQQLETVPAAAERWEYSPDNRSITFVLRDNLTYHDGSPLTAQNFVYAAQRALDPRDPGAYQHVLGMITGADAVINTSVPTDEAQLEQRFNELGIEVLDDQTLRFSFDQPTPYFHTLASLWVMYPVKQAAVEAGDPWYAEAANHASNGPWVFSRIDEPSNIIEFVPNERYWQGRPKLDGLNIRFFLDPAEALEAYKQGEVDVTLPDASDVPAIRADPTLNAEYNESPGACTLVTTFNQTKPPFDNQQVRAAFAYAFDRVSLMREAYQDTMLPTTTWIPPGAPGYDPDDQQYAFDPAKAKQALAEAGYPDGAGFPTVAITYPSEIPAAQERIEYLVDMYQKHLGVTLALEPIDYDSLGELVFDPTTHPAMLFDTGWCADYPDPQNWLSVYWHSSAPWAAGPGYASQQFDTLVDAADVEANPIKRMELYQQAQRQLTADLPGIFYANTKNSYLIKPYVQNMAITPQDSALAGEITGFLNVSLKR